MHDVFGEICMHKLIAVMRGIDRDMIPFMAKSLYRGGVRLFEYALNQAGTAELAESIACVETLRRSLADDAVTGAGTVLSSEQVDSVCAVGAELIVSPNYDVRVIDRTKKAGAFSLPGAATPGEMIAAFNAGADMVKLFPAAALGTDYVRQVHAPVPHLPIVAVGGIDAENAAAFLKAGCCAVAAGGSLCDPNALLDEDGDALASNAALFIAALNG